MFSSQNYGSPVFWTSNERPERRLLNPTGAFNDPFYPHIRVKNRFLNCVLMFDHVVYTFPYGVNQDALEAPLFRFRPNQIGFRYFASQFMAVFAKGREIAVTQTSTSPISDSSDGNRQ